MHRDMSPVTIVLEMTLSIYHSMPFSTYFLSMWTICRSFNNLRFCYVLFFAFLFSAIYLPYLLLALAFGSVIYVVLY